MRTVELDRWKAWLSQRGTHPSLRLLDGEFHGCEAWQALKDYLTDIYPLLHPSTVDRLRKCDGIRFRRILSVMKAYRVSARICPWSHNAFMVMLLDNEEERYPRVWQYTLVAMAVPQRVRDLPDVLHWHQNWTVHGQSCPLHVVIRGGEQKLKLRFESWVLLSPRFRRETVLAWRTQSHLHCPCCGQAALWVHLDGRHGCGAHIMQMVALHSYGNQWRAMKRPLSKSKRSSFEQMLSRPWFSTAVFDTSYTAIDDLSCSCGGCTLTNLRCGVMCPLDASFVESADAGPAAPRIHNRHLADGKAVGNELAFAPRLRDMLWQP